MQIDYQNLGLNKKDRLIVAVSGGPDSVCLLDLLKKSGFENIIVAHLDHQIRGQSHEDAELVRKMANNYGYQFELKTVNAKKMAEDNNDNLEAVGRKERYRFFRELKDKYKAKFIITAHHADDQLETVLMNIIRGCGLEGLSGMKETDNDIWRPLLPYPKEEIFNYCSQNKLKFIQDLTNNNPKFRRNFLRLKVVPLLKELNPNLLNTMNNNIRIWTLAENYLSEKARSFLETQSHKAGRYELKSFLALDKFEQQVVLRAIFEEVHGHKQNLIQEHLEQVLKVLRTNVSGKQKEFGPGKVLVRGRMWFEVKEKDE